MTNRDKLAPWNITRQRVDRVTTACTSACDSREHSAEQKPDPGEYLPRCCTSVDRRSQGGPAAGAGAGDPWLVTEGAWGLGSRGCSASSSGAGDLGVYKFSELCIYVYFFGM